METALELRGGINLPVGDFSDTPGVDAKSVAGFGADLLLPVHRRIAVYVGGGREIFDCRRCQGEDEVLTTGLGVGTKAFLPMGPISWAPWFKVGAVYHRLDFEVAGISGESDWGLGFQAAVGLDIPLGEVLAFSPAVRYHSHTAELESPDLDFLEVEEDVRFFSFDLAIVVHPGTE